MSQPLIYRLDKNLIGGSNKIKVIFLDIDGVLNRHSYGTHIVLVDELVENLKKIMEATDAKIVLSTFWRGHPDYIKYILNNYDINPSNIIDVTPGKDKSSLGTIYKSEVRSHQISDWVKSNKSKIYSYVILDDRDYAALGKIQLNRFVKTHSNLGLTQEDVNEAISILNNPIN